MSRLNPAPTDPGRYTRTAVLLHWLLAVLLIGEFAFGVWMHELPFSPARVKYFNWHKSVGVVILLLTLLRLVWRFTHRPPPLSAATQAAMPAWQKAAHHGVLAAMYLLALGIPLAGWAYSSASGFPIVLFGTVPWPDLMAADKEIAPLFKAAHKLLALGLALAVLAHIGAAFKHHFIDRDGLLDRMRLGAWLLPALLAGALLGGAAAPESALAQTQAAKSGGSTAAAWKLDAARSELSFTGKQMGVPMDGQFKRFDARLEADAAKADEPRQIGLSIELSSASLGSKELEVELAKVDWFGVAKFPQARFVSQSVRKVGADRWEAQGTMELKGRSRPMTVPFTLQSSPAGLSASGSVALRRLDFGIGDGEWADPSIVANEVAVKFRFVFVKAGR
jgi:cytochrome b561